MKKSLLSGLIPFAAFIALAGSGFGAWVFSSIETATTSANFKVTNAISLSGLTINVDSSSLTLNQSSSNFSVKETVSCAVDFEDGIIGTYDTDNKAYTYDPYTGTNTLNCNYNLKAYVFGGLANYIYPISITYDSDSLTTTSSSGSCTSAETLGTYGSIEGTSVQSFTSSLTAEKNKKTYTINFAWCIDSNEETGGNGTMKPDTQEEYTAMTKIIKDSSYKTTAPSNWNTLVDSSYDGKGLSTAIILVSYIDGIAAV